MPINCSANSFLLKGTVPHTAVPQFRGAMENHSPLNDDFVFLVFLMKNFYFYFIVSKC